MHKLGIIAISVLLGFVNAEITCYFSTASSGELQSNNTATGQKAVELAARLTGIKQNEFQEPSYCRKSRIITWITYSKSRNDSRDEYLWSLSDVRLNNEELQSCSERWYGGHAYLTGTDENRVFHQVCNCCGDRCNNQSMDSQCNEDPVFTKECYAAGVDFTFGAKPITSSSLPSNALVIPGINEQHCYRGSFHNTSSGETIYFWGETSIPSGYKCGDEFPLAMKNIVFTATTCCGDKCNGEAMNDISDKANILTVNGVLIFLAIGYAFP